MTRIESLMCKFFSLLRKIQNAYNYFASEKKNPFNPKYVMEISLIICPTRKVIALILEFLF